MKKETLEAARKNAKDASELYGFTVDSLEPDIHMIDAGAFYASAAISLKRIADALEFRNTMEHGERVNPPGIVDGWARGNRIIMVKQP